MAQPLNYLRETASRTCRAPTSHRPRAGARPASTSSKELGHDIAGPNAAGERVTVGAPSTTVPAPDEGTC